MTLQWFTEARNLPPGHVYFLSVRLSVILAVLIHLYYAIATMYFVIKRRSIVFLLDCVIPSLFCQVENFRVDSDHLKFPLNFICNMTHINTLPQLLSAACRGGESLFFFFTPMILVKFLVLLFIHGLLFLSVFPRTFSPVTRL